LTSSVGTQATNIDSRIVVVDSKVDSTAAKVDSVGTQTGSVGTQTGSVGTQVTSVGTEVASVGTQATDIDSRIVVVDGKVDSVGTQTGSVGTQVSSVGTQTGSVGTQVNSVGTQASTIDSKVDSLAAESGKAIEKAEFSAYVFQNNAGSLADGGNDYNETSGFATAATAWSILASLVVDAPENNIKTVKDCELDLGWTGIVANGGGTGNGDSKWAVKLGNTATLTSATDIPGTSIAETISKDTRWRTGQYIDTTNMATLPFTVMLAGKVTNANDTLTCTGLLGTTVAVVYEIS